MEPLPFEEMNEWATCRPASSWRETTARVSSCGAERAGSRVWTRAERACPNLGRERFLFLLLPSGGGSSGGPGSSYGPGGFAGGACEPGAGRSAAATAERRRTALQRARTTTKCAAAACERGRAFHCTGTTTDRTAATPECRRAVTSTRGTSDCSPALVKATLDFERAGGTEPRTAGARNDGAGFQWVGDLCTVAKFANRARTSDICDPRCMRTLAVTLQVKMRYMYVHVR
jgi:hypothetical protein